MYVPQCSVTPYVSLSGHLIQPSPPSSFFFQIFHFSKKISIPFPIIVPPLKAAFPPLIVLPPLYMGLGTLGLRFYTPA